MLVRGLRQEMTTVAIHGISIQRNSLESGNFMAPNRHRGPYRISNSGLFARFKRTGLETVILAGQLRRCRWCVSRIDGVIRITRKRHTLPIHCRNIGTRGGISKRRPTTRSWETHEVSLREGSTDDVFSVAYLCGISLEEHLCCRRYAPDTSGDTLQLRGEHTERDTTGTKSASATPPDNVNLGREVTKPTSLNRHCRRLR